MAERESPGADTAQAAFHARAVLSVLDEALQGNGLDDVRAQLGGGFSDLFVFDDVRSG